MRLKLKKFFQACESQWVGGGSRYAFDQEKEWTDVVCDTVGDDWIGGNIIKYAGEIRNGIASGCGPQEVNFFKIAVYAFIWWIKREVQRYSNLRIKKFTWPFFCGAVEKAVDKYTHDMRFIISSGREIEPVDEFTFTCLVTTLVRQNYGKLGSDATFFKVAANAFYWWMDQSKFSDPGRDKGEEFSTEEEKS